MSCAVPSISSYVNGGDISDIPQQKKTRGINKEDSIVDMKISLNSNQSKFTPAHGLRRVGSDVEAQKPELHLFRKNSFGTEWQTPLKEVRNTKKNNIKKQSD